MPEAAYDVVVIGAGPTGENVADQVVKGGLRAVIVESGLVGGNCSYSACMPSKAMLRSPSALAAARAVDGARQAVTGNLDAEAVLRRRTRFTDGWHDDAQVQWLQDTGIDLVRGRGRLAGKREVEVERSDGSSLRLTARHAVAVCTGSDPLIPPIEGLAEASPWTNQEATRASAAPVRLAILGGGPVGCEMATAWKALGTRQVAVIQRGGRLLDRLEPFVGDRMAETLREQGIAVLTGRTLKRVRRSPGAGPVQMWLEPGGQEAGSDEADLESDELLVATGRTPRTKDLGLETVQLKPGQWLDVDDSGRILGSDSAWLYAAGDVTGEALQTHMGKYQGRACGAAIVARVKGELGPSSAPAWSRWAATAEHGAVPQVIFTEPEVASVGRTEAQAREAGLRVRVVESDLGNVPGARLVADGYQGWAKLVIDEDRRVVVGATFVGPGVGEMLHAATIAVVGAVPLDRLWHAVPSYPTISEIWLKLLETYGM
jgi:pyruvate/2-oxoglutarate dehydrogenase complex dihydrolipoamide dehydrogenase (E3) component